MAEVEKINSTNHAPRILPFIYRLSKLTGRGYGLMNRILFMIIPNEADNRCIVEVSKGSMFGFRCADKYWNVLFSQDALYEPDLHGVLKKLKSFDFTFLDVGANYGYWSILVSSKEFGSKKAIAVELDPENYVALTLNSNLNENRFSIMNRGIYDVDGLYVTISSGHHSSRHISEVQHFPKSIDDETVVETITLATLAEDANLLDSPLVIKLDVEGAERKALGGFGSLDMSNLVIIYEEHGKDPTHENTSLLMKQYGFKCFFISDDGNLTEICKTQDLTILKRNEYRGYNAIAVHGKASNDSFAKVALRTLMEHSSN